jgi:hypothetical protein
LFLLDSDATQEEEEEEEEEEPVHLTPWSLYGLAKSLGSH